MPEIQQDTSPVAGSVAVRAVGFVIGVTMLYAVSSAMSPGDGTFKSESKPKPRSAWAAEAPAEDDGWGDGTRGSGRTRSGMSIDEARARATADRLRQAESGRTGRGDVPVYDPNRDSGWGD